MKLYGQEDTEDMVIDLKNILEEIDRAEGTGCALVELRYSYNRNFKVQHSRQYRALKTAIDLLSMITEKNLDTTLRYIVYQVVMAEHKAQFYATTTPKNADAKEMIKKAFEDIKGEVSTIQDLIDEIWSTNLNGDNE